MTHTQKNNRHKAAFIIWLAIYPLITLLYSLLGNYLSGIALPLRTLVLTLIAVPIMFYVLVPLLNRVFHRWLNQ